ncbi:uncharacterized protein EHS24_004563 [Apiotrichum porosum]|uniref:Uncharacterized protein n=1 Tax=Apiotrichum porosum TaxID=105984 RepID=A0A427Y5F7_9TREE|nr:uncharacterized protein EHS24_004563 [Apiotrichum porosum]RSH86319.1 hypothetical protein EHS24_004563 [Apiotrichum porosum]
MSTRSVLKQLTEVLATVHKGHILELRLNTPKNLNAFGGTKYLVRELIEGFNYARDNDDIKAVVVTANGRFFSAGAALTGDRMVADENVKKGIHPSLVTFPPLFGSSITSRLLYMAETIPIAELSHTGLFAEVLPQAGLPEKVIKKVEDSLADLSIGSIVASKSMLRTPQIRDELHRVNAVEMDVVDKRRQTDDHRDTIVRFQQKRAAAKSSKAKL